MAVLPFDLEEEERLRLEQENGGQSLAGAGTDQPGGTGGTGGGTVPDAPTDGGFQSPQAKGLSGWVDINAYLDANRDQSAGLADKVSSGLTSQLENVRGDIEAANQRFRSTVDQGATRLDQDLIDRGTADPTSLTPEERERFKKMRTASYGGPSAFSQSEDFGNIVGKTAEAVNRGKSVDTEAGREEILTSLGMNPTKGQVAFDQLLIGANPEARGKLSAAAKPFEELNAYLDQVGADATTYAGKGREDTDAARAYTENKLGAANTAFQENINQRLAAARQEAAARATAAKTGFGGYVTPTPAPAPGEEAPTPATLTDQQLADLGISKADADAIKQTLGLLSTEHGRQDFTFDPYFTERSPDAELNVGNIAGTEDYARLAALEDLMGMPTGFLGDPSQAGTANLDTLDFRGGDLKSDTDRILMSLDEQVFNDVNADQKLRERIGQRRGWGTPPTEPVYTEPKEPALADFLTDTGNVRQLTSDRSAPIIGETGSDLLAPGTGLIMAPTEGAKQIGEAHLDVIKDPKKAIENVYEGIKDPKKAITNVGKKVEKKIKKVFCFAGHTPINMEGGEQKPIRDIKLGDRTTGGEVISVRHALVGDGTVFDYNGIMVTGMHAVHEDGQWIRVKDSPNAKPVENGLIVYSVATTNHRLFSGVHEFADEQESDHYEDLTIDESLDLLNGKTPERLKPETTQNGAVVGA